MKTDNPLLDNTTFLFLAAGSMFSGLFFVGAYLYAGTVIPSTRYETETAAIVIWTVWTVLVVIPIITVMWLLVFRKRRQR